MPEQADQIEKEFSEPRRNSDVMDNFGLRLRAQFSSYDAYRRTKELEWLESLRQKKGIYDPDVKIEPNNSKVYPKITRSKLNIVLSRLHEMLFPETDKNWEIIPTPEPRVSRETVKEIVQSLIQQNPETGETALPTIEDVHIAINDFVEKACGKMSQQIDDQLTEMQYPEETKKVLRSGLDYGTGIMKGPLISKRTKRRWEADSATGDFVERTDDEEVPYLEAVRIWDWYPDMSVTEIEKMTGSYQRHTMTKHDLRLLIKRDDFYGDIITQFLSDYPNGNYVPKNWEVDLQTIEIEASTGKHSTARASSSTSSADAMFDDNNAERTNRPSGKKYEVLEFWGYVDGADLQACGVDIEDVELEYGACIWVLGNKVIKSVLFDTPLDQYKVFYYEKDETSIFGEGLARIIRHSALSIGAGARMVLDNAACVAGPQVECNWSLMTPDTDINSIYPRKIWFREGRGVDAQYPALRALNFDSHIAELLTIIDRFENFADIESTLPTWLIGQATNNETAQATSGRQSMITISIKDVVKNFDAFTEKIIRDLYTWNMEFNPRQDIKGDYQCKARGVSSLVMKEIRMQALAQLTTTLTPEEWQYIPRRDFLEEKLKAHDIIIKLKTEEQVQKETEARQQSMEMQLAVEMQKGEIAYKRSQTMAMLSKAKEKDVAAAKDAATPIEQPESADPRLQELEVKAKELEMMGKVSEMQQGAEAHRMDMAQKDAAHQTKMTMETAKVTQDMGIKAQSAAHGMMLKEKMTEAGVQAKKTAASKPKNEPKPKKVAKKEK